MPHIEPKAPNFAECLLQIQWETDYKAQGYFA